MSVPVPKGRSQIRDLVLVVAACGVEELVKVGWEIFRCGLQSSEYFRELRNPSRASVRELFSRLRSTYLVRPIVL